MCCVTSLPEYPPLRARQQPSAAATIEPTVATPSTKPDAGATYENRLVLAANSRRGTRIKRAMGKCTASKCIRPKNCISVARSYPSGGANSERDTTTEIETRVTIPNRVVEEARRGEGIKLAH